MTDPSTDRASKTLQRLQGKKLANPVATYLDHLQIASCIMANKQASEHSVRDSREIRMLILAKHLIQSELHNLGCLFMAGPQADH